MTPDRATCVGAAIVALACSAGCDDDATSGATSSTGAGGAGGIGSPSDVYPAPFGDPPQCIHSGGPILASPTMIPVVFEGDDPAMVATVVDLANRVAGSDYWRATTEEYGVGPLAVYAPLPNGVVEIAEQPPAKISPAEIDAWLRAKLNADDPALPAPIDGAIYTLFYPAGVSVEDAAGGASCSAYSGYHASVVLDAAHGSKSVAYAVIPRCAEFFGRTELESLTSTTTHELIEAATDPYAAVAPAYYDIDRPHAYWVYVFGGGEVSDMCNLPLDANVTLPGTNYQVQRSWSNAAALAGRDPCVPTLPDRVYFNASPILPDDLVVANGVTSKGVRIPEGGTRTIAVRLFSEGPTAPIKVIPEDWGELNGGSRELELSLDEPEGVNGQTLHLTIRVVGSKPAQLFRLSSTDGTQWTGWIGVVGR